MGFGMACNKHSQQASTCVYATCNGKQLSVSPNWRTVPFQLLTPVHFVQSLHRFHQSLLTPALAAEKTVKLWSCNTSVQSGVYAHRFRAPGKPHERYDRVPHPRPGRAIAVSLSTIYRANHFFSGIKKVGHVRGPPRSERFQASFNGDNARTKWWRLCNRR